MWQKSLLNYLGIASCIKKSHFWESQKREYLQQNPNHRGMFEELETSADAAEVEEDNGAVELIWMVAVGS